MHREKIVLTYDDLLEQVEPGGTLSVLLGNGFARAWQEEPFAYETLYDAADFGPRENEIRRVFATLETQDFEKTTSRLYASRDILRLYTDNEDLVRQLQMDANAIKDALLQAIADTHPVRPNAVSEAEYRQVREFLATFTNIYTVNYDLLMYWARNQSDVPPPDWDTDDGFRGDRLWIGPETDQQVFFLHGAMHLYETSEGVKKHAFSEEGHPIIDTVQANLQRNIFPLFVSEATSDAKLGRINRNPYLSYCLRNLSKESEYLFIFGHGFSDVDQHIFSVIDKSDVSHVFISLYGDPRSEDNRRLRGSALARLHTENREVSFVDAATVPVWRNV